MKHKGAATATGGKAAGDRLQSLSTQLVPFATQSDYRRKKDN